MNPAFSGKRGYALVEPPALLFFFAQIFASPATTSLLFNRSTEYLQKISDGENDSALDYVVKIMRYKDFVDILVPALLVFFLGPWSDSYGRKPLLVAAYAGSAMSFLLWLGISYLGPVNPWIFVVASLPAVLVGGYCTVNLATYSYITDIRQESDRAWDFIWLQTVISVGRVCGYIATLKMGDYYEYATIFGIAAVANLIATLYVLFFVPESVTRPEAKQSCSSLFNLSLIKDMFATCVRKRDGFDRVIIWCCVCVLAINALVGEGEWSVFLEITLNRFHWAVVKYFWYSMGVMLLIAIGTILGGLICKALIDRTVASMSIAVLATASALAGSIAKSCATESWHLYLSALLGILGGLSGPVVRNALSKSAPPQDVGKVFTLTTSVEAIISLVAGRLYRMVYSHYMPPVYPSPVYPSPVYLVSVGFYAFVILMTLTIKWRISKMFKLKNPPLSTPNYTEKK